MPATIALVAAGALLLALPHVTADPADARGRTVMPAPVGMGLIDTVAAATASASAASASAPSPSASDAETDAPSEVFAEVGGIDLRLPAEAPVAHGFHEAAGPAPVALAPVGTETPLDAAETQADTSASSEGPDFLVLPSRGRGQDPTSAADVVVGEDEAVLAPVDGVVTMVADYQLYGSTTDTLIYIRPTDAPHLQVELLHLDDPAVAEGDRVAAGETVVAGTARRLSFASQIDRFVGESLPHVHVEVTEA